jgi:allantoate deiminase
MINIIPGHGEFSLDLRDIDEGIRERVEERILERAAEAYRGRGVVVETELLQRMTPAPCSETVLGSVERACREIGVRPFVLASSAAHDGMQLVDLCPMVMIFVHSRDGVSHSPEEWSSREDCEAGAEVLYRVVLDLAGGD